MAKKTIYGFAKHCMNDLEFNCGGIPSKEKTYAAGLGMAMYRPDGYVIGSEDLNKFYDAMNILRDLHIKYDEC